MRLLSQNILLLGAVLLALPAGRALAQGQASCTVASTSRMESSLNTADGEDEDFLGAKIRALPQIAWVLDTSATMRRFPTDLLDPEVRAAGTGLTTNTILDALVYAANPCEDARGQPLNPTPNTCLAGPPRIPDGWGMRYNRDALGAALPRVYAQYETRVSASPGLFDPTKFYVHDRGWGQGSYGICNDSAVCPNPTGTAGGWVFPDAITACANAYPLTGLPFAGPSGATEQANCATALADPLRGYYLPDDPKNGPPVVKGNWANFYPPKYVIARRTLVEQFDALTNPVRIRQMMATMEDEDPARCYSSRLGIAGFDGLKDGARRIHSSTDFKPPCINVGCTGGAGGGVPAFGNAVYNNNPQLFTSPTVAPVVAVPPVETPAGYTLTFAPKSDGLYDGEFVNALDPTDRRDAFCAPYAEMLLNVGTYMGEYSVFDNDFNFGDGTYPTTRWGKAGWVGPEICPASTCSCSRPTMILIAGGDPGFDDNLPCEITGQECPALPAVIGSGAGTCGSLTGSVGNVARMARYLATRHLRPTGGFPAGQTVSVNTFVIGFGTDSPALVSAAAAGGGSFILADDAQSLKGAINETLKRITTAELSFSNANISAVQTRTTSALIVPRFTPSKNSFWKGKLSRYQLVSEFGCGCTVGGPPATGCPAGATADYNGDGKCDGVYFMDASGSWIAASSDGAFRKVASAGGTAATTDPLAVPVWDASDRLDCPVGTNRCSAATGAARSRKIMTVTDSNNDGLFDYRDEVISFDTAAANLTKLIPYLNLDATFCAQLSAKVGACLDATSCASKLVDYVRGMDIFDENCNGSTTDERPGKLGDIFHSSPVLVDPPLPSKSQLCRLGLHNQCLISLFATPTLMDPLSKYDDWVNLAANKNRDKFILVGANDGMVHAFNAGVWDAANSRYDAGTGDELWAFIPPDLLPKLSRLVDGSKHQYYVDGTPMIRDIWADSIPKNHVKSADEFHTVAVIGERRGGNSFFALDVTTPDGPALLPATGFFRWTYPQPNTIPGRVVGNSYSDFLPTPPPIGPVRIKDPTSPKVDPNNVPYEERWIALLNGGYDGQGVRGRLLSMVDVWYGGAGGDPSERKDLPLWAFVPGKGPVNFGNKADFDKPGYPFVATPGLVGFGPNTTNVNQNVNDYFFDTATLGDTGGQLWAFRFNDPDPATWSGGRMFAATSTTTCSRQPFYQVTSNVISAQGGHLRTLVGTGDRFNLNDRYGGECSASNLVACVRRGCKLHTKVTTTICDQQSEYERKFDNPGTATSCPETQSMDLDINVGANCCTKKISAKAEYELDCTNSDGSNVKIKWNPEFKCEPKTTTVCGAPFAQYACTAKKDVPFDICQTFDRCQDNSIEPAVPKNSFYAVKAFDDVVPGRSAFKTTGGANAYDGAMLTQANLKPQPTGVDPYTPTTAASVAGDNGWFLNYGGPAGRPLCSTSPTNTLCIPTDPNTGTDFPYAAANERTASQAAVVGGCAFWQTFTPADRVNTCGTSSLGMHTTYQLNMYTGNVCTGLDPSLLTSRGSSSLDSLPPAPPQLTVFLPPDNSPDVGSPLITITTVPRGAGSSAPTTKVASRSSLKSEAYTLDVPRGLHACRHQDATLPVGTSIDGSGVSQHGTAAAACQ